MIKGVNKRVVEITGTESEFFEKAVLYVRADKCALPPEKITREARNYLNRLVPSERYERLPFGIKLGAAIAVLFALIAVICLAVCL